ILVALGIPAATEVAGAATTWKDWTSYHGNGSRLGYAAQMPAVGRLAVTHRLTLDGAVYASPIVVKGVTIVATENDTVYAFDPHYRQLWRAHLGTPSPGTERPCGNIDPLGITGTPVYAAATGLVYVAAEFSGNPPTHQLYGISFTSGAVRWHRSLDLPGVDSRVMQERGALMARTAGVYVPFGGLNGDCGDYKGRVVRYALNGAGNPSSFTVPTTREAGIWTPPGVVYGGATEFVSVGNGESGVGDPYDYSDSVLELSTSPARVDSFSPTSWPADNDSDLDLGSQAPALVGNWVFIAGKSGTAYVLRRSHLGGIGGQVSSATVCRSFGGTAVVGSTVYVPCADGVRAVSIDSTGHMHVLWHAAANVAGSPIVGAGRVWSVDHDAGVLYGLSTSTGRVLNSISVGVTSRFATPAAYGHHIIFGTMTGLTVVNDA
ncbi:MAG TPA: PQQ-binding-like beta-propeller repeat protein, partial [Jatrophihabitans sp.]|nr:PQQ-binding-like beta-propeller repeat protein [Jatrophihabitans sp.]